MDETTIVEALKVSGPAGGLVVVLGDHDPRLADPAAIGRR